MGVDRLAAVTISTTQEQRSDTASTTRSLAATSPPTKRSYCPSPQLDVAQDGNGGVSDGKVVRARLCEEQGRSDVKSQSLNRALGPLASASEDLKDRTDLVVSIPGTPPELAVRPGELELAFTTSPPPTQAGTADKPVSRNSPEYLTEVAERQIREFDALELSTGTLLAKLCSQHWLSEYNTLKRSIAVAAAGVAPPPALPIPPTAQGDAALLDAAPPHPPSQHVTQTLSVPAPSPETPDTGSPSTRGSSQLSDLIFLKPSTAASTSASRQAVSPSTSSTGLTPRVAKVALCPLTTAASDSLASMPPPPPQLRKTIAAVEQVLIDLDQGESVQDVALPDLVTIPPAAPAAEPVPPPLPAKAMFLADGSAVKTSLSHPINISPLIPVDAIAHIADRVFAAAPRSLVEPASEGTVAETFVVSASATTDDMFEIMSDPAMVPDRPSASRDGAPTAPVLGNFVLSSCPGKKVRMNGEASKGGRGAICRDVTLDLARARDEFGVRLVICCLDDAELHFLGVPWPEYVAAADLLGLEVVRMPMLEGFAPESPERLDADLAHIVRDYTLRGHSVLAHCRGGIGRAGLVASCWMLKMGLVAPISSSRSPALSTNESNEEEAPSPASPSSDEPLQVLSKVIDLIRRRRNVKAIETPHQVHFLHQYISYLQERARPVPAQELLAHERACA
ncbi:hypothetical protein JCM8115_004735 [Rhodotorula mucilaginosa]|nr:hypothetical protein B0A53_02849 [Rhodotorula sp. CCFEE 5036]